MTHLHTARLLFVLSAAPFAVASGHVRSADRNLTTRDTIAIPVSNADLGTFPYFKTLDNFTPTDSVTQETNRTYFYDGKKFFSVDGRISAQNLNIKDDKVKIVGEFGCIDAFDKVVARLGGVKIFTGRFPEVPLKAISGEDLVTLGSKYQIAPSGYYGVVEYVIKTPSKEVWVQLQPYSLGSKFYSLLVVEKTVALISLNTNRPNKVLSDLTKNKKAVLQLEFFPDSAAIKPDSRADMLQILGVFQQHPEWKLSLESYCASFGNPAYSTALTLKRAEAIQKDLAEMGVKPGQLLVKGMGEQKPLKPNDTETGRKTNDRVELLLL